MNNIKIKTIQRKMKQYYSKKRRLLPWRAKKGENQNPYQTLISEIMLQQTRVNTVLKYFKKFLKKFPNLKMLALASNEEVLKSWSGMGYYRRAINLHKTAKIILKDYQGIIPSEKKKLINLPGIGDYTSAAIASFAYGKDEIVIDTNVERFITRIYNIEYKKIDKKKKEELAKNIFPKFNKGDFAQAIMDFSNDYCIKLNPKCDICVIKKLCNYKKAENIKKIKITKNRKYCTSYFLFKKNKLFFVRQRPINQILGGLYEIPSTEWTEKKKQNKNLFESLTKSNNIVLNKSIKHEFSHFVLFSKVMIIKINNSVEFEVEGEWVSEQEFAELPLSSLAKKIVDYSLEALASLN